MKIICILSLREVTERFDWTEGLRSVLEESMDPIFLYLRLVQVKNSNSNSVNGVISV